MITGLGPGRPADDAASLPAGSVSFLTEQMLQAACFIGSAKKNDLQRSATAHPTQIPDPQSADRAAGMAGAAEVIGWATAAVPRAIAQSFAVADMPDGVTTRTETEAALLIANTISAAIDGESVADAIDIGLAEAAGAPPRGRWTGEASVVARALQALEWADNLREAELVEHLGTVVGVSAAPGDAVPAALVIARAFADDPYRGLCAIAQMGGETCLIGALAGAALGASCGPDGFPSDVTGEVDRMGEVAGVAARLLSHRGTMSRRP